jgi:hypothetical protein
MKSFWLKFMCALLYAFSTAVWTNAQSFNKPIANPIEIITGDEFLQGDEKGPGDEGQADPARPTTSDFFPHGALGDLLRNHMKLMTGVGQNPKQNFQDAENAYQDSLRDLRKRGSEVIPILYHAYEQHKKTDERNYFRRWALVETIRELQHDTAVRPLAQIAISRIPPERFKTDPERSSVDEEIRIRVTALEGLGLLVQKDEEAENTLLSLIKNQHLGIRRAAIRGYLAAAPNAHEQQRRSEKLKAELPHADHHLITVATTDIKKIPHPNMPDEFDIIKSRPPEGLPPAARNSNHE